MRPIPTHAAWSVWGSVGLCVCLSVCWTLMSPAKWPKQSRCRCGCGLVVAKESCIRRGAQSLPEWALEGHMPHTRTCPAVDILMWPTRGQNKAIRPARYFYHDNLCLIVSVRFGSWRNAFSRLRWTLHLFNYATVTFSSTSLYSPLHLLQNVIIIYCNSLYHNELHVSLE